MRQLLYLLFILLMSAVILSAGTLNDPFGIPQGNCGYSFVYPYSSCDVIGEESLFDIQKVDVAFDAGMATIKMYFNTGAVASDMTLHPFTTAGDSLIPGDVFFYSPDHPYDPQNSTTSANLKYGIPLVTHNGLAAGSLYQIGGPISTETAIQALNSGNYYRRGYTVLMTGSGPAAATGTVTVANNGNGTTSARYLVTLSVPTTPGLMSLLVNNQIGILFASADCGNDVIQGDLGAVPESPPSILMAAGMGLIGLGAWRRRTHSGGRQ